MIKAGIKTLLFGTYTHTRWRNELSNPNYVKNVMMLIIFFFLFSYERVGGESELFEDLRTLGKRRLLKETERVSMAYR